MYSKLSETNEFYYAMQDNILTRHFQYTPCKYPIFIQEWFDRVYTPFVRANFNADYSFSSRISIVSTATVKCQMFNV